MKNYKTCNLNYLYNYDLINKYQINSLYKIPKIKYITLELYLNQIQNVFIQKKKISDLKIKLFLITYLFNAKIPYIIINKKKEYSLKFNISSPSKILDFIERYDINFLESLKLDIKQEKKIISEKRFQFIKETTNNNKLQILKKKIRYYYKYAELTEYTNNLFNDNISNIAIKTLIKFF